MARTEGILKLILYMILLVLILSLISTISDLIFGGAIGKIVVTILLILSVLWLLSAEGKRKLRDAVDDAGLR